MPESIAADGGRVTLPAILPPDLVYLAAQRLATAEESRVACAPVRDLIGSTDVRAAYAVQAANLARRLQGSRRVVGRKIGLTSRAVQAQLGVDQPDFGVLLDDMVRTEDSPIDLSRLLQPRVEAEIAFVMSRPVLDPDVDSHSIRNYVDHAVGALEIVDSRIEGWDITIADTIADNASSGLFVLGKRTRSLAAFEPRSERMSMSVNGDTVSTGDGSQCLGDPLGALAWLARTALQFEAPLEAGDLVLSGALGPMVAVGAGDVVVARFTGLGELRVAFTVEGSQD